MNRRQTLVWGLLVALGALGNAAWLARLLLDPQARLPFDFAINWTATRGLLQGISLYDNSRLLQLGLALIGPDVQLLWADPFTSYIGPPTTALLLLPFTPFAWPLAMSLYRLAIIVGFVAATWLLTRALPPEQRRSGWLLGLGLIVSTNAYFWSFSLGQVDALVTLALAAGMLALSRRRDALAGAAFGLAALLKVSPAILLLYLLLRGRWRALAGALIAGATLLAFSMIIGQPGDLATFLTRVSPALAGGTAHPQNQSIAAQLARLAHRGPELITYATGLGLWRWIAPAVALGGLLLVWLRRGDPADDVRACALLVLVGLLAGPISWAHYASWALIPVVLLTPRLLILSGKLHPAIWALLLAWLLLALPLPQKDTGTLLNTLRAGLGTVALLLLLGSYALARPYAGSVSK